jgi:hypothetical protein
MDGIIAPAVPKVNTHACTPNLHWSFTNRSPFWVSFYAILLVTRQPSGGRKYQSEWEVRNAEGVLSQL